MILIQIVLSVIYIFTCNALVRGNKFLRFLMLFIVTWYSAQLTLAISDPYNHWDIRPMTILAFNLQIIFLILGARAFQKMNVNKDNWYNTPLIFNINSNKTLIAAQTLCLVYAFHNYSKMRTYLMSLEGITNSSRTYYFTEFFGSYTEVVINQIISSYSFVSYFVLFALAFFSNRKLSIWDYYLILSSLVTVVLTSLTTMGRFEMMELVIVYLFFFFFSRSITLKDKKISKRINAVGVTIFIMMIVVISSVTMFRNNLMGEDSGSVETLYESVAELIIEPFVTYFYGPILAFDYRVDPFLNELVPMCGGATLGGIIDFILMPFTILVNNLPTINHEIGSIMTPMFWFPTGRHWNALFTGASNYYIDFGYVGFVFFPFILGWLLGFIGKKAQKNASWFIVFLFFFIAAYKSAFSSNFQSPSMIFTFLWILLLNKQKSIS